MLSVNIDSPQAILRKLGTRFRARRLAYDWSRKTLALRSGVAESTIKRFELTGNIGVAALIQLCLAIDAANELALLFPQKPVVSLDEVRQTGPN